MRGRQGRARAAPARLDHRRGRCGAGPRAVGSRTGRAAPAAPASTRSACRRPSSTARPPPPGPVCAELRVRAPPTGAARRPEASRGWSMQGARTHASRTGRTEITKLCSGHANSHQHPHRQALRASRRAAARPHRRPAGASDPQPRRLRRPAHQPDGRGARDVHQAAARLKPRRRSHRRRAGRVQAPIRGPSCCDRRVDRDRGLRVLSRHPGRGGPLQAVLGRRDGRRAAVGGSPVDPRRQRSHRPRGAALIERGRHTGRREPAVMIEAEELTKRRGGRAVVSDVTFSCEPGTVTGFLGPNGAGKTTTMRMLVGLSVPDSGQALLFGERYRDLPNPGRRVGILLDASAQHAGRRGREALAVSAQMMGVPAQRVDTLLELVGLDETVARRRVGQYSLGMRQRLGLAHALLGDPEVLILDEPANGLDPEGMRWMRGLLRGFADRGGTVLLSSHLLAEVEAVADRMIIIGGGRIRAQGTRAELLTESGTIVEADALATLDAALDHAGLAAHPADGDRLLVAAEPEVIARLAMANDVVLRRLAPADGAGLERLFIDLTTASASAPPPATNPINLEQAGVTA